VNAALNALQAWWQGGQLIDFIIGLTVLEACALLAYHRLTGKGLQPAQYALNLVAGLCLMVAVRSVLLGHHWLWTVLCMSSAGLAHWTDLWRGGAGPPRGQNP
jgi:hypothetical protein